MLGDRCHRFRSALRLADHGFTGKEDFAVTVVVPNIPELERVGQFGLYAGVNSTKNIRGGMISTKEPGFYNQFLVKNLEGRDHDITRVGLGLSGDDLRMTLRRTANNYSLTIENLTTGSSTTVAMPEPGFLENETDVYVGFFGANTCSASFGAAQEAAVIHGGEALLSDLSVAFALSYALSIVIFVTIIPWLPSSPAATPEKPPTRSKPS